MPSGCASPPAGGDESTYIRETVMLDIAGLLITLTALFAYVNHRFIKLPTTIGVMAISLVLSLVMVGLGELGYIELTHDAESWVGSIDFYELLMEGMLSLLLFAGAMHIDLSALASHKWSIGILATVGVVASTFVNGGAAWVIFQLVGIEMPFIYCLLFGTLISPTDPIAVLAILRDYRAPKSLEIKISGESLFNDGVVVVVFIILSRIAMGSTHIGVGEIVLLFGEEALGGILFGLGIGFIAYGMLKSIDNHKVEVLITLALVLGGYALANHLHVSGPIAMVVSGLMIGNHGRALAMSDHTREHLDTFWELVDEILNAILFVLIGLEMIIITFTGQYVLAAVLMIPLVILTRFTCVGIPIGLMRGIFRFDFAPHAIKILTWGGLRGGISVALALSLPVGPDREVIVTVTYVIVLFSILVQGWTIGKLVKHTG